MVMLRQLLLKLCVICVEGCAQLPLVGLGLVQLLPRLLDPLPRLSRVLLGDALQPLRLLLESLACLSHLLLRVAEAEHQLDYVIVRGHDLLRSPRGLSGPQGLCGLLLLRGLLRRCLSGSSDMGGGWGWWRDGLQVREIQAS
jgi:hypothetical protein